MQSGQGKKEPLVFKLDILDRMLMVTAMVLQTLMFIIFLLKLIHYSFYPIPKLFNSQSLVASLNFVPHFLLNGFLYSLFFYQHVVMALVSFKKTLKSYYHKSPLYQRYLYNICSSWTYILILQFALPVSLSSTIVFEIPSWVSIIMSIIGGFFLLHSMMTLGGDVFSPFPLSKILTAETLTVYEDDARSTIGLKMDGMYGIVRHPMQFGSILSFAFASPQYTIDRIVFIIVNILGIVVGVFFQEKRLCKKFADYPEYKKKVKSMLIPFLI